MYRLGLDVGANSIGWACLALDDTGAPSGLIDLGARVFPDGRNPKDGSSLAVARRLARSMRRRRDRYLARRAQLLSALQTYGLMPAAADERTEIAREDPYGLRQAALQRRLEPYELGRALFHLNQRRGFKSNRKLDRGNEDEAGKVQKANQKLQEELHRAQALTLGDWLAQRHERGEPVRVRLAGTGQTAGYEFYPSRGLVEAEFDTIWRAQSEWNPALTDEMRDKLRHIIFHQRPLKPVLPGKCWLEPAEFRAPRALPITQRFRIAQTVSHIRITEPGMPDRLLDDAQRSTLLAALYRGQELSFNGIRKLLHISKECDFSSREDKISGDETAARLAGKPKAKTPPPVGASWHDFDLMMQNAVTETILAFDELDGDALAPGIATLISLGLSAEAAERAIRQALPDGHAALSAVAMLKMLPFLEAGMTYDKAVQAAGYAHHSQQRTGELRDELPYYGELLAERLGTGTGETTDGLEKRYGRAPNPTVHVALNEIRRVVNAVIARHGLPTEIVVETLRDLGRSKKQREEQSKKIKDNEKANDKRRACLAEMGLRVTGDNMIRLRLLDEQAADPKNRFCPYSGTLITPVVALSDRVEIDHILPFAVTLDDSMANKILVMRDANRAKGRQTPYQAFHHKPEWADILARSKCLPPNKSWRFAPDALERLAKDGDFLARHLTDSATIARWAVFYLQVLTDKTVHSIPGRLTGLLRHGLGMNSATLLGKGGARKDRNDHRHHAIDAVVVALTDRKMLKAVSDATRRGEDAGERLIRDLSEPWPGFIADVAARLQSVIVSHKPDTGVQGALHNDTAYGDVVDKGDKGPNVVVRKPVAGLAGKSAEDIIEAVRDPHIAQLIAQVAPAGDAAAKAALATLRGPNGAAVKRIRQWERLDGTQMINDRRSGKAYKLVKRDGNYCAEFWRLPNAKYDLRVVSRFEAAAWAEAQRLGRTIEDKRPHPAAKLLFRLHINDTVAFGHGDTRRLLRVVKMSGGQITLAPPQEGGALKARDADRNDAFKYVSASKARFLAEDARKVWVDPAGRLIDPGRPK